MLLKLTGVEVAGRKFYLMRWCLFEAFKLLQQESFQCKLTLFGAGRAWAGGLKTHGCIPGRGVCIHPLELSPRLCALSALADVVLLPCRNPAPGAQGPGQALRAGTAAPPASAALRSCGEAAEPIPGE